MSTKQLRTELTAAQLAASGQFLTATSTGAGADLGHTTRAEASVALQGVGMYARANILGTVSQSGGVPTGAIMQRGSNANGEFVRYADGVAINFCLTTIDVGSVASQSYSYPSSFADVFLRSTFVNGDDSANLQNTKILSRALARGALNSGFVALDTTNQTGNRGAVITVFGRWY